MESTKIGVVCIRSTLAVDDKTLNKNCDEFLGRLSKMGGFEFVEQNSSLMNVFFVQTGGSEIFFKEVYAHYAEPYLIIARRENNSLAASLEIVTFLQNQGKKAVLLFGDDQKIVDQLTKYARFYYAKKRLSTMRLGVIGKPSDWLIASNVDYGEVKRKWGTTILEVPYDDLLNFIKKGNAKEDDPEVQEFISKGGKLKDVLFSLNIEQALKRIAVAYSLDGFTLRCFDLVTKFKQTSCLGFGMLNDMGVLSGCEGDVPALLTMAIIYCLYETPSFMANPSDIDIGNSNVTYAHCTCPLSMCESYHLDTHFESHGGIGIAGQFRHEEVTAVKLHPNLGKLLTYEGNIINTPFHQNMCRTQIDVHFDTDISKMIETPFGNHLVFMYGHHQEELQEFFDYLA